MVGCALHVSGIPELRVFKHPTDYDYISQDDTTLAAGDAVIMTMFTGGGFASRRLGLAIADHNAWPET